MKNIIRHTLAAMAFVCTGNVAAQQLSSAYFMDGFSYGHELNPAKDFDRSGYFTVPLVPGNLNFAVRGNLGLQDIFRQNPNGNGLVTYLHPSLSTSEALSGFSKNNKLTSDLRYNLLGFGFHSKHAYQNFTVGIRVNVGANLPYEIFDLTKNLENRDYSINDLGVNAKAWVEAGWGYSRNVAGIARIGGKVKLLLGAGYANINVNSLDLNMVSTDRWTANADISAEVGLKGLTWGNMEKKEYSDGYLATHPGSPKTYDAIDLDNAKINGAGVGGFGMGLDLGAELNLNKIGIKGLKLSAAILDLGFIKWNNVAVAQNKGDEFIFEGFDNIKVKDGDGTKFGDQTDDIGNRFSNLFALQDAGTTSQVNGLGATLNIGAEYTLPIYKKVALGLLSTTRLQGVYSWNEERISANYHPTKWVEVGVNGGFGTLGTSLGWIVNFHPFGLNLFVGGDHILGKVSKQMIPLKSNANIAMGINFTLGKSRVSR